MCCKVEFKRSGSSENYFRFPFISTLDFRLVATSRDRFDTDFDLPLERVSSYLGRDVRNARNVSDHDDDAVRLSTTRSFIIRKRTPHVAEIPYR